MKKNKLYALVERGTVRVISIVDESMIEWYKKNMTLVDIVEVASIGSGTSSGEWGFSYISVHPINEPFKKYYMITTFSDKFNDVNEVYKYIDETFS